MIQLRFLFNSPNTTFFLPITLIRVVFGFFFFAAGFNKVFIPKNQMLMLETITGAGIPFPEFMAVFVSVSEAIFGLLLVFGLLTRLASLGLLIITLVAIFTVELATLPEGLNFITWISYFFYLPQVGYVLMALLLIVQGSGPLSLDQLILKGKSHSHKKRRD